MHTNGKGKKSSFLLMYVDKFPDLLYCMASTELKLVKTTVTNCLYFLIGMFENSLG